MTVTLQQHFKSCIYLTRRLTIHQSVARLTALYDTAISRISFPQENTRITLRRANIKGEKSRKEWQRDDINNGWIKDKENSELEPWKEAGRVWRRKDRTRGWVTTKGGQRRISGAENKQSWLGRSSLPQSTSPALLARETKRNKRLDSDLHSCDWGNYVNPEKLNSADHCTLKWRAIPYCLRQQ